MILSGTGIMIEIEIETKIEMGIVVIAHGLIGHDLGLDQRVDPVEDQGLVLVQDQRGKLCITYATTFFFGLPCILTLANVFI